MRDAADFGGILEDLEGALVALRLRRGGPRRWIQGLCLAVGGRPTTRWRRGAHYLLIEVHEHVGVQHQGPPSIETNTERLAVGGRGAAGKPDGLLYVLVEVRADAKVEEPHPHLEPLSEAELEEVCQAMGGPVPPPGPQGKPS